MSEKKNAFVLTPFHDPINSYYMRIYKPALEAAGYVVRRADDIFVPRPIMLDVQESILNANLILCDMSGRNPNVFYELGLAHAIGKPVILVSNKEGDIPFDLEHVRTILYDPAQDDWEKKLREQITAFAQSGATGHKIWPPPLNNKRILSLANVIIVVMLLLTGFLIYYLTSSSQRREYQNSISKIQKEHNDLLQKRQGEDYNLIQRIYKKIAQQVKARFEEKFMSTIQDNNLNVSYWYGNNGHLYQLATTEEPPNPVPFTNNKTSIIGCAFAYPNYFVERDDKGKAPIITPYNRENRERSPDGSSCHYYIEGRRGIKYIVCFSYNATANPEYTVGICVYTESDNNFLSYPYRDFLRGETKEFAESAEQLITDKKLIPQ